MRSLFIHFDRLGSFVAPKSMGAQTSKAAGKEEAAVEKPTEGAAVAAKANGQVRFTFDGLILNCWRGIGLALSSALARWRAPCSM